MDEDSPALKRLLASFDKLTDAAARRILEHPDEASWVHDQLRALLAELRSMDSPEAGQVCQDLSGPVSKLVH